MDFARPIWMYSYLQIETSPDSGWNQLILTHGPPTLCHHRNLRFRTNPRHFLLASVYPADSISLAPCCYLLQTSSIHPRQCTGVDCLYLFPYEKTPLIVELCSGRKMEQRHMFLGCVGIRGHHSRPTCSFGHPIAKRSRKAFFSKTMKKPQQIEHPIV